MSILQNYVAPLAPIGLIIGYFLYQPQLRNTGIILSLCLSVVGCIAYALFQDVPATETDKIPLYLRLYNIFAGKSRDLRKLELINEETLSDLVGRLNSSQSSEITSLLQRIKKKIHQDKAVARDAADLDVIFFAVKSLTDVFDGNDPRIGAALEIVNEMLYIPEVRVILEGKIEKFHGIIDLILTKMLDFLNENKIIREERDLGGIGSGEDAETEIDESATVESINSKNAAIVNSDFLNKYAHKFVIALGLLATDSTVGQSGVGDRGGIKILIQYMKEYGKVSPTIAKWGCWALSNLALSHPPNKREIVHQGGIPIVVDAIRDNETNLQLQLQAYHLLVYVLMHDPQTKMSLAQARQIALTHGVVDIIYKSQALFKDNELIQECTKNILEQLLVDWS